jgi:hypothetical protein
VVALNQALAGPGEWIGVRGDQVVALLPPQASELAAHLWVALDSGAGFEQALDVLLRAGLGSVPSLVLAESLGEARLRLLVRGTPGVTVRVCEGPAVSDLTLDHTTGTWREELLESVQAVEIRCTVGADLDAAVPMTPGLRRIGSLRWGVVAPAEARDEAVPVVVVAAPEAEPDVAPVEVSDVAGLETAPLAAHPYPGPQPVADVVDEPHAVEVTDVLPGEAVPPLVVTPAPVPHWQADVTSQFPPVPGGPEVPDPDNAVTEMVPELRGVGPVARIAPVARVTFSHGLVVDLDRPCVVGRAPMLRPGRGDARTVTVPSPLGEVSATHVEIRPGEGPDVGRVVVVDLGSTNGSIVLRAGQPPLDLLPGVPLVLREEAVVDLGDGATFTVAPA